MENPYLFRFDLDYSLLEVPSQLNNPFDINITKLIQKAVQQFQAYLEQEKINWEHNFEIDKGKMFGLLIVQNENGELFFIGTVSGKLKGSSSSEKFIPSVFDDSLENFKINKGMSELTTIGLEISAAQNETKRNELIELRRIKSNKLQKWLFDNYVFQSKEGSKKSVSAIFKDFNGSSPPAAAGECAAPKLLNFAFSNRLKPISLAEFWYGRSPKSEERKHLEYYPACENKCRPILEFMLDDQQLFKRK